MHYFYYISKNLLDELQEPTRLTRSWFRSSQVFYIKGIAFKAKEDPVGSTVRAKDLEVLSSKTGDALANTGNLVFGGSP